MKNKSNRDQIEVELKNKIKMALEKEKLEKLEPLTKFLWHICLEKECDLDETLNIGGSLMGNASKMLIKGGVPKERVLGCIDHIFSFIKDLVEEEE